MGFRERYFRYYRAESYEDRKGRKKVRYVYKGDFIRWGTEDGSARKTRKCDAVCEIAGGVLYIATALLRTDFNSVRISSGFGLLGILMWLIELWGVLSFLFSAEPVTEPDRNSTDGKIRAGSLGHGIFFILAAVTGCASLLVDGSFGIQDAAAAAGCLGSGVIALIIHKMQRNLGYRTYKNVNGEPGPEY